MHKGLQKYWHPDSKPNGGDCSPHSPPPSSLPLSPLLPSPFTPGVMDECVAEDTMAAHITTSPRRRECEQTSHRLEACVRDLIDRFVECLCNSSRFPSRV